MISLAMVLLAVVVAAAVVRLRSVRGRESQPLTAEQRQVEHRRLGYRYGDDLVFVQGESAYAGVVISPESTELATDAEVRDTAMIPVSMYATLLSLFDRDKVLACQELVRYRPVTTEGFCEQLLANCWNPSRLFKALIRSAADYERQATPQRLWVLIVRLGEFPRGNQMNPLAGVESHLTGVAQEAIDRRLLAQFHQQAQLIHDSLSQWADPLKRNDLVWLIRKPTYGSIPVPEEVVSPSRPWRGGFFELAAHLRARNPGWHIQLIKPDADTDTEQTCFTATLVVADDQPRKVFHRRHSWGPRIAALDFPVEITWHYTLIPPEMNARQLAKIADRLEGEASDRAKVGADADPRFQLRMAEVDRIQTDDLDDPQAGMIGRLRLHVTAPSTEVLLQRVNAVKRAMGKVQVERPEKGQLALLEEQFPGGGGFSDLGALSAGPAGGLALWARRTDLYSPAMGMLAASTQVGDRVAVQRGRTLGWIGPLAGWVKSNGNPFHTDPQVQLARSAGAGIAAVGASGSGKTSFALNSFFWASEAGTRCLVADPMVAFRNFTLYIAFGPQVLEPGFMDELSAGTLGTPGSAFQPIHRQFWDDTDIIDLATGARGLMDPWHLAETFEDGYRLAQQVIDVIFGEPGHRTVAKSALRELREQHRQDPDRRYGLADILEPLRHLKDETAQDLSNAKAANQPFSGLRAELAAVDEVIERLEQGLTAPLLRLVLGRGDDPTRARVGTKRRTIFTMAGYQPASSTDPAAWTDDDRNAAVTMRMLLRLWRTTMTDKMVPHPVTGRPARAPSMKYVDEGYWFIADEQALQATLVDMRQGRTYGSGFFYIDQQPKGIAALEQAAAQDEPEVNQFPTVFVFGQASDVEAREALALLRPSAGLSRDAMTAMGSELIKQDSGGRLEQGEAMVRDVDGSRGVVRIDMLFDVLRRAAQTNAALVGEDWSYPVPADPADWTINPEGLTAVRRAVADARTADVLDELDDDEAFDDDLVAVALSPGDDLS